MQQREQNLSYFDEQWSSGDLSTLFDGESDNVYYDAQFSTYFDATSHLPLNDGNAPYEPMTVNEPIYDDVCQIFEFVDFEGAPLEFEDCQISQAELHMSGAASSETQYSPWSGETIHESSESLVFDSNEQTIPTAPPIQTINAQPITGTHTQSYISSAPQFLPKLAAQMLSHRKRPLPQESAEGDRHNYGDATRETTKRKRRTQEQLERLHKVRVLGACLRCYVQNIGCSEGRPCKTCHVQFEKDRKPSFYLWTSCVPAVLPDVNIFSLNISIFSIGGHQSSDQLQNLDSAIARDIYISLFESSDAPGVDVDGQPAETMRMVIDDHYKTVLRHMYGSRAAEVQPFILTELNPLYLLVKLNVILLGSPILGPELIGCVRFLQKMRSISATLAFECLGKALRRTTLAAANLTRQSALIISVAVLLDQVMDMNTDLPAAALSCSRGSVFNDMRQQLIQYLLYYLHKLLPTPAVRKAVLGCVRNAEVEGHLGEDFWHALSEQVPAAGLQKPPMLRRYADMTWDACGVDEGAALCEFFTRHCAISST